MNEPIDQPNRERFVSELDKNFSVVAAAGSGKTRAITDRIVQIAKSDHALDWLPQLVVVAFTNRAADEMQQRARAEVLQAGISVKSWPRSTALFSAPFTLSASDCWRATAIISGCRQLSM